MATDGGTGTAGTSSRTKANKRRYCCVKDCHSREGQPGIRLYRFPGQPWEKERRRKWIVAVRRVNEGDGSAWIPSDAARMPASLVPSMQEELCQDMNDGTEGHLLQGRQSLKTQGLTLISVTARTQPSIRPAVPPALRPVLVSMAWTCSALQLHWRKSKLQTRPARLMMLTPVDVWLAFCAA
ncbi:uncharacterized protein LOC142769371 isoform X2 [Rhipicephalus microplus]|uniref:uncharacterized protein LOC142769371 isoform X2 n=1 Tax=Rhipicephalus microplus TaxID=6941 RepID=UPI003F6C3C48